MPPLITPVAQLPRAAVTYPQYHPSPSLRHPDSGSPSVTRQYSRWVRKKARDGPRTSPPVTQMREKDSPENTRIRFRLN